MLTKTTKKGAPYVLVLLYLLGAVPIFLGMDLGCDDLPVRARLQKCWRIFTQCPFLRVLKKLEEKRFEDFRGIIPVVLVVSSVAAVVLGVFYFISNDLKVAILAVTAGYLFMAFWLTDLEIFIFR